MGKVTDWNWWDVVQSSVFGELVVLFLPFLLCLSGGMMLLMGS
jgi:hypothetical protein